jgi:hypothetical protein
MLSSSCVQGRCTPNTACPHLGDSCAYHEDCDASGYCEATTGECTVWKGDGQPCEDDAECGPDGSCSFADGVCRARVGVGAECGASECVATAYCDYGSFPSVCRGKVPNGAPCPSFSACADPDASCLDGVCGYRPACEP